MRPRACEVGLTTNREDLEAIGFEEVGSWRLHGDDPRFVLNRLSDAAPVLYAFVIDARVMYVGKTVRTLGQRLYGYQKGAGTQRTNIRVRNEIRQVLSKGHTVGILAFHEPRTLRLGRFALNLPAALEDDVIRTIDPAWNGARNEVRASSRAAASREDHAPSEGKKTGTAPVTGATSLRDAPGVSTFEVTVGQTYYRQGFFNVPKVHAHLFPRDGGEIEIGLSQREAPVRAGVNRTANQNGTPRIMGGPGLRDWFQKKPRAGYLVRVRVQGNGRIDLTPV